MHLRRAVELDPLNLKFNDNLGQGFLNARHDDQGLEQLKKTVGMDANFAGTYADLASLYRYQGHYDLWIEAVKKNAMLNENPVDLADATEMERVYKQSGYKATVNRIIEIYKARTKNSYVDPGSIAEEYAFLGDQEHAFEWLEKAFQARSDELASIRVRRCFDFLRSDPRYKDLERRIGYTW